MNEIQKWVYVALTFIGVLVAVDRFQRALSRV
jgi:hypothetical protein